MRSILSAAALTFALFATPAFAEEMKIPRTISLTGHGEVRMAPDMVTITVGVLSQGNTASEALTANTASMNAVFDALKSGGVETKDIQTSNFMVQPRYDYNNNTQPPKLVGYDVSNNVMITLRQIDAQQLPGLMPDLREHARQCRFYNCTHLHEPACGVRAALARGEIAASRYRIYGEILAELVQRR